MIEINNITSVTGSQFKPDPSDIIKPLPESGKKESAALQQDESVTISTKAKKLQQDFNKDKASLEENYIKNSKALEREYLQEKKALEREFSQKERSLKISLYV